MQSLETVERTDGGSQKQQDMESTKDMVELKNRVIDRLNARGILSTVKAQLRAEIFSILEEEERTRSKIDANISHSFKFSDGRTRLCLLLVIDFLNVHGLRRSLQVLRPETKWDLFAKEYTSVTVTEDKDEENTVEKQLLMHELEEHFVGLFAANEAAIGSNTSVLETLLSKFQAQPVEKQAAEEQTITTRTQEFQKGQDVNQDQSSESFAVTNTLQIHNGLKESEPATEREADLNDPRDFVQSTKALGQQEVQGSTENTKSKQEISSHIETNEKVAEEEGAANNQSESDAISEIEMIDSLISQQTENSGLLSVSKQSSTSGKEQLAEDIKDGEINEATGGMSTVLATEREQSVSPAPEATKLPSSEPETNAPSELGNQIQVTVQPTQEKEKNESNDIGYEVEFNQESFSKSVNLSEEVSVENLTHTQTESQDAYDQEDFE